MNVETFKYDNRIVRAFAIATVVWGDGGHARRPARRPPALLARR